MQSMVNACGLVSTTIIELVYIQSLVLRIRTGKLLLLPLLILHYILCETVTKIQKKRKIEIHAQIRDEERKAEEKK
jgi:hypothetical protein